MAPHSPGPTARHRRIAVVGAGPRGLSVLERLLANERSRPSAAALTVHLVDPYPPGAGRVWRTNQSRLLLMNTVASQVTAYTDPSVTIDGPVEEGPSLYEWAKSAVPQGGPGEYDEQVRAEARALTPDAYPTRAFYGRYLRDVHRRVRAAAPPHCRIVEHRTRAVRLTDADPLPGAAQVLVLANGRRIADLDAVVLALGHLATGPTAAEHTLTRAAAAHGLVHLPPANPADLDLDALLPGRPVLVRGLGLNFFDHLALLTRGRGGRFAQRHGRLVYHPSGEEPLILAGSRRGVPYHARGENEKGAHGRHHPRLLTEAHTARLRERAAAGRPVRFARDLWPLVAREVEAVYYATLLAAAGRPEDGGRLAEEYLAAAVPGRATGILDRFGVRAEQRWDWHALAHPYAGRRFASRAEHRAWIVDRLERDVHDARAGNLSGPLKAALDVLRDLRNEIRLAVDHGGIEGSSYRDELESWYTPLNAFLSIGPPASRIDELRALIEAGVVDLLGPDVRIALDPRGARPAFTAHSPAIDAPPLRAGVLVEARLPEPDLRRTGDRLLRGLLDDGQADAYRIPDAAGPGYRTGGLAVTERPYRLLDTAGRAHPRRFAYGIPTEAVHWVTAAGIRPGVNSVTLGDSDAIARAVLALHPLRPAVTVVPAQRRPAPRTSVRPG